jgi:DegV family protein with EDD domain
MIVYLDDHHQGIFRREEPMSIQLVTDSTCDLPDTLVQQLGIHIVPLYVNMDGNSYLDGYDLTREEFYDRIEHSRPHPTTAAPGIEAFKLIYQRLFDAGTEGILSIHVAKSLSNTCGTAELAAQE